MARRKKVKEDEILSEEEVAEVLDSAIPSDEETNCPVESELKVSYSKEKKQKQINQHPKFDKFKKGEK